MNTLKRNGQKMYFHIIIFNKIAMKPLQMLENKLLLSYRIKVILSLIFYDIYTMLDDVPAHGVSFEYF
jgi:hypothetical protein